MRINNLTRSYKSIKSQNRSPNASGKASKNINKICTKLQKLPKALSWTFWSCRFNF